MLGLPGCQSLVLSHIQIPSLSSPLYHLAYTNSYYLMLVVFRALLFIAHGYAEHCLQYEKLATKFTDEGVLVFSHDHSKLARYILIHFSLLKFIHVYLYFVS